MIEAMGPLGYEGIYRKTCEVTLKILRDYREPLTTILKTFIYDPLVEWKTTNNCKTNETGETISAKVKLDFETLEKILNLLLFFILGTDSFAKYNMSVKRNAYK